MITLGQPQHLGNKTLMLILSRRTTVAFILFIVNGALVFLIPSLAIGMAGISSLGGSINQNNVTVITNGLVSLNTLLFLGSIIIFLITLIIGFFQYRNFVFILDEFSLKIRKGILSEIEISVPYRQIQDINLLRTFSHRMFGVSRLIIITAGHEDVKEHDETDTVFDPIDADLAEEIRSFLERRIGVQVIEGTTQADSEEVSAQAGKVEEALLDQNHA